MITASSVLLFNHHPQRAFRFERYYLEGKKMWRAACQFDVRIELDPKLPALERGDIEYRQFICGGVWIRRGNEPWTSDDKPNGNVKFRIPPYAGQSKVQNLPMSAVSGTGLSFQWKEDGEVESGKTERYGYRDTATMDGTNEKDIWKPHQSSGFSYHLRDTPSIGGEWGLGLSVEVWIELYFEGYVVQVERDANDNTLPVKVLKKRSWNYFWPDQKLSLWMNAAAI